jgi:glutathione-regulated potassium-efflux system ancillary protein KefG
VSERSSVAARRRVLVLFAHPAVERSRVNRVLAAAVRDLPGVTFHDLYDAYPDFDVDVGREQALLAGHDAVVVQHPLYWYSTPALLKEWADLVLEHGWAYGTGGTALRGKIAMHALTSGGRESTYGPEGGNRFTIRQFLTPMEQTARLCGMDWLAPFVVHGTHVMTAEEIRGHGDDYRAVLEALRDGRLDLGAAREAGRLNADLRRVIGG